MHGAELVLALLIAVAALVTIARGIGISYPIFLVIGGLLLGLVPRMPRVHVDPDVIYLIVLPPLLYIAAYLTPIRGFRANIGTIGSLAIGLVAASALAVGVVAHALIPGIPWSAAMTLGAIVAPPDAIAATAIASRLGLPRQIVTILEGESLVNDATALTIYNLGVGVAGGSAFSTANVAATFAAAFLGGCAIGIAVGWGIAHVRRRIEDTPVEITISLLTPYAAFLPAERLGVSGVIAAVAAGLYLGHHGSRIMGADARLTGRAVWETLTFLLNGFVFIVMGLEVPAVMRTLTPSQAVQLVGAGLAVSLVMLLVRAVFVLGTVAVPELVRRRREMPYPLACSLVLSWAGMRGVVSLAAALALPTTFAFREAIVIVTLTVIVVTLLGHGLSLPWLVRLAGIGTDAGMREEEAHARERLLEAASLRVDELYPVWPGHHPLLDEMRAAYAHRSHHVVRQRDRARDEEEDRELIEHREIRRTVIDAQREALVRLSAEGEIHDEVLRELERELDLEERRMDA